MNLLAFAQPNLDHLIGDPVCRVQYISRFREQDEIPDWITCVQRPIVFHHVSERLNRRPRGKTALPQREPIEQDVLTLRVPDRSQLRKIRFGGEDDRQHGPQDRDARNRDHEEKGPKSLAP